MLARLAVVAVVVLALVFFGPYVVMGLSPFIIAYVLARLLQRPVALLERTFKNRSLAAAVMVLLVTLAACGLLYWLVSFVVGQLLSAANDSASIISAAEKWIDQAAQWLAGLGERLDVDLTQALLSGADRFNQWLSGLIGGAAEAVLSGAVSAAAFLPGALIYANFLVFGAYYLTKDYDAVNRALLKHTGINKSKSLMLCGSVLRKGLVGYLRVQLLYAVIVFVVSCPVLSLLGIRYSALIALFLAILEFLPLFGNGTLLIPWAAVCLLTGSTGLGLWLLGTHLVLFAVRKVTEPRVMSAEMGLSPILSLVGMYVGMRFYGVLGLILGPIVCMLIKNIYQAKVFQPVADDMGLLLRHFKSRFQRG